MPISGEKFKEECIMLNQNFENCFLTRSDPDLLYSEREKIEKGLGIRGAFVPLCLLLEVTERKA